MFAAPLHFLQDHCTSSQTTALQTRPLHFKKASVSNMTDRETYMARAAEARAQADAATLDNVRDRCLRSESAWNEMAARAERTERMRETLLADKAKAAAQAAAAEAVT